MGSAIYAKMFKQELKYDESKEQDNPEFFKKNEDYMADRKAEKNKKGKPIQLDAVDLGTVKTKKHMVSNNYQQGAHVDENDIETSTGKKESGQTFSSVKIDEQGNKYITRLPIEK
tara:strand:+ start:108 stop:452 length:345 start_codon:yes stop_codon:yes gene_type:complete